jgi:hypothetical protein
MAMKKSQLHKLIKETIKEAFFDQEGDDLQHDIIPGYYDAALYFIGKAESEERITLDVHASEMIEEFAHFLDDNTDSLPDSILKVIDVPDEPMWGPDDVDPAGGSGPSSHI